MYTRYVISYRKNHFLLSYLFANYFAALNAVGSGCCSTGRGAAARAENGHKTLEVFQKSPWPLPPALISTLLIFGITTAVGTSSSKCKVRIFDLVFCAPCSSLVQSAGGGVKTLVPRVQLYPKCGGEMLWERRRTPWKMDCWSY